MPIRFACVCGKTLQVKDEFAGRRVRCPACGETPTAPAAGPPPPAFEVVEDEPPAPPPRPRARVVAEELPDDGFEVVDEPKPKPRPKPPKKRRPADDDDRPRAKKRRTAGKAAGAEKSAFNTGVAGGLLAMIVAVVWFVGGLFADIIFFYPPVLFVIGLVGFIKGLSGGNDE